MLIKSYTNCAAINLKTTDKNKAKNYEEKENTTKQNKKSHIQSASVSNSQSTQDRWVGGD